MLSQSSCRNFDVHRPIPKMVGKLITRSLFFSPASIYICLIHPIAKIGRKNAIIICFPRLNDDPFIGTHFLPRTVISGQKKKEVIFMLCF